MSGAGRQGIGPQATATWLRARSMAAPPATLRWHIEIALGLDEAELPPEFDEAQASRFHLDLYAEEWSLFFCHGGKASCVRITDLAFVHGRDEHALLAIVPPLRDIGMLLRELERRHGIQFQRKHAVVRTNLANAEPAVRSWLATL